MSQTEICNIVSQWAGSVRLWALLQKLFGITIMVLHYKFAWRDTAQFAAASTTGWDQVTDSFDVEFIQHYYSSIT